MIIDKDLALREAEKILKALTDKNQTMYWCQVSAIVKDADSWLNKYAIPNCVDILMKVKHRDTNMVEFLSAKRPGLGITAFIACGDHKTKDIISVALLEYCRKMSVQSRTLNLDANDRLVSIEGQGDVLLSVNHREYPGTMYFAGGYMRD